MRNSNIAFIFKTQMQNLEFAKIIRGKSRKINAKQ